MTMNYIIIFCPSSYYILLNLHHFPIHRIQEPGLQFFTLVEWYDVTMAMLLW